VTGGGGGLGEVIAGALARLQMHVVVADVDGEAARRVATAVGGTAVTADLSDDRGVDAVIAAVGEGVDVLVNCAGGWSPTGRNFPDAEDGAWESVLALNLRSPMRLLQRLRIPLSRSPVGAAVSISSSAGLGTGAYESPEYAVAKAGLIRLTTAVADWGDRFGVRVACVVPGWIGLPRAVDEVAAMPASARPILIPPEHIADEVVRLVTDPRSGGRVVVIEDGEPGASVDWSPDTSTPPTSASMPSEPSRRGPTSSSGTSAWRST
jgi:NAD(P)-dependent dehydrogenase (short-subunit alcohol dehydrogenase family)